MNETKRIGISLRVEHVKKYDEKRDVLSQDWILFLQKLNIFPILIPNNLVDVKSFLTEMNVDGIILSGGDNIGEYPERDKTEKEIIDFATDHQLPILGVCRGMQVLNEHFGGKITQNKDSSHVAKPHLVEFTDSKFAKFFGTNSLEVNSFHNNIIKEDKLGKDLEIFALTKTDRTVEGYFHKFLPIIGVMWHPERDRNMKTESVLMEIFKNKSLWSS